MSDNRKKDEDEYKVIFMLCEYMTEQQLVKTKLLLQGLTGKPVELNSHKTRLENCVNVLELAYRHRYLSKVVSFLKFNWEDLVDSFDKGYG